MTVTNHNGVTLLALDPIGPVLSTKQDAVDLIGLPEALLARL